MRYDYQCRLCDKVFEESRSVSDRHLVLCECGGATQILILTVPADHSFQPYYDVQLGARVASKNDKKARQQAIGVESVGDAKDHEVDSTAAWNKNYEEKKREEKDFPKFMESYKKVQTKAKAGTL